MVSSHKRNLADRSTPMIMTGYEEGSKAYRLCNPSTNKVMVTCGVVFEEDLSWIWDSTEPDNIFTVVHSNYGHADDPETRTCTAVNASSEAGATNSSSSTPWMGGAGASSAGSVAARSSVAGADAVDTSPTNNPITPRSRGDNSRPSWLDGAAQGSSEKRPTNPCVVWPEERQSLIEELVPVKGKGTPNPEESGVPYVMEGSILARNTRKEQPRFVCLELIDMATRELASTCVHDGEKHQLKLHPSGKKLGSCCVHAPLNPGKGATWDLSQETEDSQVKEQA
jgi:hypothetical protein